MAVLGKSFSRGSCADSGRFSHSLRFSNRCILVRFDVLVTLPIEVAQDLLSFHLKLLEAGIDPRVGIHAGQNIKLMLDRLLRLSGLNDAFVFGIGLLRNDCPILIARPLSFEDLGPFPCTNVKCKQRTIWPPASCAAIGTACLLIGLAR